MPELSFRDLIVWQRALELSLSIYKLTQSFPREELFGLISQLRRAAVSIPSNVAEGEGRATQGEFRQFLGIAKGFTAEVQTLLIIARELKIAAVPLLDRSESLAAEVSRMLTTLIATLK